GPLTPGGSEKDPRPRARLAAGDDVDMLQRAGAVDESGHASTLRFADERAELGLRAVRRAELQPRHGARQACGDLGVDLPGAEDRARRRTVLTGVVIAEGLNAP